ncbi:hypothetical protein ACSVH2_08780 [Flavobacterium sp. RSB2_4_14]|uniref:hypothetical protein n=1 Tax=Flavobacterium sp. RSB2_4_14 TaxID=3447665 RepID=UPI003F33DB6C
MVKPIKISAFVKFENVLDFARELDTVEIVGYYMKPFEVLSKRNIPLYVISWEEVTTIYILTVSSSDWVRENLNCNIHDERINLSKEFMCKFDLIRVIPEGGVKHLNSYLRVTLKQVPENAKPYSIEQEMYGDDWESPYKGE